MLEKLKFSARAYHRILRVSRTIADLEKSEQLKQSHLAETLSYRRLERILMQVASVSFSKLLLYESIIKIYRFFYLPLNHIKRNLMIYIIIFCDNLVTKNYFD